MLEVCVLIVILLDKVFVCPDCDFTGKAEAGGFSIPRSRLDLLSKSAALLVY